MKRFAAGRTRATVSALIAVLAFAAAGLVGIALARTFTLRTADNGRVIEPNGRTENERIVVNAAGEATYELSGDSRRNPKCTRANGCFRFWFPVTVSSRQKLSKPAAIRGKLTVWHRNGILQLTLQGHPLYTFAGDAHKGVATGDQLRSFGGTWHVEEISPSRKTTTNPGSSGATTPATPTTSTTTTAAPPSSGPATTGESTTSTMTSPTTTTTSTTTATTPCLYPPCY